jgi:hypothetical protein
MTVLLCAASALLPVISAVFFASGGIAAVLPDGLDSPDTQGLIHRRAA